MRSPFDHGKITEIDQKEIDGSKAEFPYMSNINERKNAMNEKIPEVVPSFQNNISPWLGKFYIIYDFSFFLFKRRLT